MSKFLPSIILMLCINTLFASNLRQQLAEAIKGKDAKIGVAIIINGADTATVGNERRYPLMSVMKFHQALTVANYLDKNHIPLNAKIAIKKEDLKENTYSPLRDKHPDGGIDLEISQLLNYTLQLSDNNACDILFDYIGGTKAVNGYIHSLGIIDCQIHATENDMHRDISMCYENNSTPFATALLAERFYSEDLFSRQYKEFIKTTMTECATGKDRLPAGIPGSDAIIGHKTGTGDRDTNGRQIGCNDAGFVVLPDGSHYSIAVFITDSGESDQENARIIAEISRIVYLYATQKH